MQRQLKSSSTADTKSVDVSTTNIQGVLEIALKIFADDRGFFKETYHRERYIAAGIDIEFVQDNFSRSKKGVLRGMHFQHDRPQGKLVQVLRGRIFDVVVDIRHGSNTFGQWFGCELSESNHKQLYVAPGFAHGFLAMDEINEVTYKCTEFYAPDDQHTLAWNDPTVGITWPKMDFSLSDKDENGFDLETVSEFVSQTDTF